jgi:hypothetical protein
MPAKDFEPGLVAPGSRDEACLNSLRAGVVAELQTQRATYRQSPSGPRD